ncbi:MAG TPA: hypothetical protein VHI50_01495 [Micromonosporaceae bacterium]|nr:hypothetical protein [Micromonosporaceae bacterium]
MYAPPGALDAVLALDRPGMLDAAYALHEFVPGSLLHIGPSARRLACCRIGYRTPACG